MISDKANANEVGCTGIAVGVSGLNRLMTREAKGTCLGRNLVTFKGLLTSGTMGVFVMVRAMNPYQCSIRGVKVLQRSENLV